MDNISYQDAAEMLKALHTRLEAEGHFKYSYLLAYKAITNKVEKLAAEEAEYEAALALLPTVG